MGERSDYGTSTSEGFITEQLATLHLRSETWARFKRNRPALLSACGLLGLLLSVFCWPIILKTAPLLGAHGSAFSQYHDPDRLSDDQFQPPSATHWFGTDVHG